MSGRVVVAALGRGLALAGALVAFGGPARPTVAAPARTALAQEAGPPLGRIGFIGGGRVRAAQGLGPWVVAVQGSLLRVIDPADGAQLGAVRLAHRAQSLAVDGRWAYAHGDGALSVIEVAQPDAPRLASRLDLQELAGPKTFPGDPDPFFYPGVAAWGGHVYLSLDKTQPQTVGQDTADMHVLARDPSGRLAEVARLDLGAPPLSIHGDGPRLVLLQRSQSLTRGPSHYVRVFDLADPARPRRLELHAGDGGGEPSWQGEPQVTLAGRRIVPPDGLARELVVVAVGLELIVWDVGGPVRDEGYAPVARLALPGWAGAPFFAHESELWLGMRGAPEEDGPPLPPLLRLSLQDPLHPRIRGRMFEPPAEPLLGAAHRGYLFGGRSGRLSMATRGYTGDEAGVVDDLFSPFRSSPTLPAISVADVEGELAAYGAGENAGSAHVGIVDLRPVYGPRTVARLPAGGPVTALSLREGRLLVAAALEGAAAEHTLHVVDLGQPERPVVRGGMAWRWPVGGIEWTGRPGVAVAVAKGRLATIDLRDPDRPRLMAEIEVDTEGRSGRLAVRGDLALVYSRFGDGVDIVSVADPQRPRIVDRLPVTQERWARSVVATWLGERVVVVRDQELALFEPAGIGGGGMPGAGEVAYEPVGRWRLSETDLDTRWAGVAAFGDDLLLAGEAGMYVLRLDADEGDAAGGDGEAQEPRGVLVHRQHVALPAGGVPRTDGRTVVVAAGDGGMHVWRALAPRGAVRIVLPWLGAP